VLVAFLEGCDEAGLFQGAEVVLDGADGDFAIASQGSLGWPRHAFLGVVIVRQDE